jgi:hypothetical protein
VCLKYAPSLSSLRQPAYEGAPDEPRARDRRARAPRQGALL